MAFVEDLAPFFDDVSGFAVVATITRGATPVVTCNVIFDRPSEPVGLYDQEIEELSPRVKGPTAELATVKRGDTVTVSAVAYRVERLRPDGTGVTILHLALI